MTLNKHVMLTYKEFEVIKETLNEDRGKGNLSRLTGESGNSLFDSYDDLSSTVTSLKKKGYIDEGGYPTEIAKADRALQGEERHNPRCRWRRHLL